MIKFWLYTFLLLTSVFINAQSDINITNWNDRSVGFGCGAMAGMTQPVVNIIKPFFFNDLDKIRETLNSELPADQFLAAFFLEKLNKKKELELTNTELERIESIKLDTKLVHVCAGCSYWTEIPLNELFDKKHIIYRSAEQWFKTHYKSSYKKKK